MTGYIKEINDVYSQNSQKIAATFLRPLLDAVRNEISRTHAPSLNKPNVKIIEEDIARALNDEIQVIDQGKQSPPTQPLWTIRTLGAVCRKRLHKPGTTSQLHGIYPSDGEIALYRRFGSAVSDEYGVLFKTIVNQEKSGVLDEQMPETISKILLLVKETIEHALEARILLTYGRVLHATWMSAVPNIQKAVRLFKDRINAIHGDLETIIRSDDADESFMQIAWSSTLDDLQQAASVKGKAAEGMKNRLYDIMRQSFKLPRKAGRKYFLSELDTLCMKMINDTIDNAIIEFTSAVLTEIELIKTRCIRALEQGAKN